MSLFRVLGAPLSYGPDMAYIAKRKDQAGEVTSYQVKRRLGGTRDGDWQTERFDDEPSAEVFQGAIDDVGQRWPRGWVKSQGYITMASGGSADDDEEYRLRERGAPISRIPRVRSHLRGKADVRAAPPAWTAWAVLSVRHHRRVGPWSYRAGVQRGCAAGPDPTETPRST